MQAKTQPMYTLYYWPLPGRGVFVRSLFAFTDTPLKLAPVWEVARLASPSFAAPLPRLGRALATSFAAQPVPLLALPILIDHGADDFGTSQLSAITTYAAKRLDLLPQDDTGRNVLRWAMAKGDARSTAALLATSREGQIRRKDLKYTMQASSKPKFWVFTLPGKGKT